MPRPRFSDWIITGLPPITIDPSGTYELVVDLVDTFYPQIFYRATWEATAATTGLGLIIYRAYAVNGDGDIEYADTGDVVTIRSQPAINSGSELTTRNDLSIDPELYPRRIKLTFTNLDAANACVLFASGDR